MEKLTHKKDVLSAQLGRLLYKHVAIIDMDGFGYKHMGKDFVEPMKAFVHIDQDCFPESLYKLIICNSPWLFKALWSIVKPWIHPLTRERVCESRSVPCAYSALCDWEI